MIIVSTINLFIQYFYQTYINYVNLSIGLNLIMLNYSNLGEKRVKKHRSQREHERTRAYRKDQTTSTRNRRQNQRSLDGLLRPRENQRMAQLPMGICVQIHIDME